MSTIVDRTRYGYTFDTFTIGGTGVRSRRYLSKHACYRAMLAAADTAQRDAIRARNEGVGLQAEVDAWGRVRAVLAPNPRPGTMPHAFAVAVDLTPDAPARRVGVAMARHVL